jgi:(S)-ureidoglycine aminohydrolase
MPLPFAHSYAFPPGGMPPPTDDPAANGAIFTTAYALIPASVQRDIVTSLLPGWRDTRAWILARPLSGFAETFAQYAVEVAPGGGTNLGEPDPGAEGVIFVASGAATFDIPGQWSAQLMAGSYLYLPPGTPWSLSADPAPDPLRFHWVRRHWTRPLGLTGIGSGPPQPFGAFDPDRPIAWMPGSTTWGTTRFVDPADLRHDCHVNIVTLLPGGRIPFAETHVMEHGLYVLQGTARYLLNTTWHDVGPGDFMWLRAFCPQACIATGTEPFRYLLYKDVNRHPALTLGPPPP